MPEVHTLLTPEECPETCEVFFFSLLRKTFGFYTVKWLGLADRRPLDLLSSNEEMQSISNVVYGEAFPCLALLISIYWSKSKYEKTEPLDCPIFFP